MNKKIFVAALTVIIIGSIILLYLQLTPDANMKKEVFDQLENDMEFCEIVKEKTSFGTLKLWMICNSRPFYAEFKNEKVNIELNGWGFLQKNTLKELQEDECNFLNYKNDIILFVCDEGKTKSYNFSILDFTLNNKKEDLFINHYISWNRYFCEITGNAQIGFFEKKYNKFNMDCNGKNTEFFFNKEDSFFTLPVIIDEVTPNKEKAKESFKLLRVCDSSYIEDIDEATTIMGVNCIVGEPDIIYDFALNQATFMFNEEEFDLIFPDLAAFLFPFLRQGHMKSISEKEDEKYFYKYYSMDNRVIVAQGFKDSSIISEIYLKNEDIR